jgi:tetratricopeptide (TPR) repeat protein
MLLGRIAEGTQLAERGLGLAEELGLDAARAHLLNTLGSCQVFAGDAAGIDRIREALDLALAVGDPEARQRAYINLCDTLVKIGRLREAVEIAEEGRRAARRLGASGFAWFLAGNEAEALILLGYHAEADALITEIFAQPAPSPALVENAGGKRVMLLLRRGDYAGARAQADVVVPIARSIGGAEFGATILVLEAELEHARGNLGAARRAIREAADVVSSAPYHVLLLLPIATRLLPADEATGLLARAAELPSFPRADAVRAEAEAVLKGDREGMREAAELYASLEMPYEEARCLIDAGDIEPAREIVERLGVQASPLGQRLQEPRPIHSSPPS